MSDSHERIILSRWLTISLFLLLSFAYAQSATASPVHSYICSDGEVYSVRVRSSTPDGFTARGPWHKFTGFCKSSISSPSACQADQSQETLKCYAEFKQKENLRKQRQNFMIWPARIRHSASVAWFERLALSPKKEVACSSAIARLGCKQPFTINSRGELLKCVYEKSGFANRATGRDCYTAIAEKLAEVARAERLKNRNQQRRVAGR